MLLFLGQLGSSGGNKIADDLTQKHGWFRARQFDNPANPAYHRETTATEILGHFAGKRLDCFVTGFDTSGTLTGVGQMLKCACPDVEIVCTVPEIAAILAGKSWSLHENRGWAPNFVPSVLDQRVIDRLQSVNGTAGRDIVPCQRKASDR